MIRDITIKAVLNGFIVTVGCHTVVFQSADQLLAELAAYFVAPDEVEKRFVTSSRTIQTDRDQGLSSNAFPAICEGGHIAAAMHSAAAMQSAKSLAGSGAPTPRTLKADSIR